MVEHMASNYWAWKCEGCKYINGPIEVCFSQYCPGRDKKMKTKEKEYCEKTDCQYHDKDFSNRCSASATQHKRKYECHLYVKAKKEAPHGQD